MTPRRYEGRELPRPDEDINDQGLSFDLGTMSRRSLLAGLGLGAGGLLLAACGVSSTSGSTTTAAGDSTGSTSSSTSEGEIPDETAGPYPGDGSNGPDVLEQFGVVRSDIRSSFGTASGTAQGVPLTLTFAITDLAAGGGPMVGAAVYVWHATREGEYSMYSDSVADQNFLRGVQITDAKGEVSFTSVFPGCYDGRWPHVHFEVYPDEASIIDSTNAIATSQMALPESTCAQVYATGGYEASVSNFDRISLASDNVFGDDGGALQLATTSGDVASGYTARLVAGVDTRTEPTGGSIPGGPPQTRS
ncbi:MAG: 3,4-dioxygenase subunit beta [Mobilicoccus sp.]|nr:3,4-dioxygenase subunit beta [Mobilicoccus sp.]